MEKVDPKSPKSVLNELIAYMQKKDMKEISLPEIKEHKFNKDKEVKEKIKEYWKEQGHAQEIIDFAKSVKDLPKKKKGAEIARFTREKEKLMKIPLSYFEKVVMFGEEYADVRKLNEMWGIEENIEEDEGVEPDIDDFVIDVGDLDAAEVVRPSKIDFNDPKIKGEIQEFQQSILNNSKIRHILWRSGQVVFSGAQNHAMIWALPESKIPNFVKTITVKDTHTRQELLEFQQEHGGIPNERLNTSSVELYLANTDHPHVPGHMTLGWVRYTLFKNINKDSDDSRIWIDEIQTDLHKILGKQVLNNIFPSPKLNKLLTKKFIHFIRSQGFEKIYLPDYQTAKNLYSRGNPPKSTYTTLPSSLNFKKDVVEDVEPKIDGKQVWVLAKPDNLNGYEEQKQKFFRDWETLNDMPDQEELIKDPEVMEYLRAAAKNNWKNIREMPESVQDIFENDLELMTEVVRKDWEARKNLPSHVREHFEADLELMREVVKKDWGNIRRIPKSVQETFSKDSEIMAYLEEILRGKGSFLRFMPNPIRSVFESNSALMKVSVLKNWKMLQMLPKQTVEILNKDPEVVALLKEALKEDWENIKEIFNIMPKDFLKDPENFAVLKAAATQDWKNISKMPISVFIQKALYNDPEVVVLLKEALKKDWKNIKEVPDFVRFTLLEDPEIFETFREVLRQGGGHLVSLPTSVQEILIKDFEVMKILKEAVKSGTVGPRQMPESVQEKFSKDSEVLEAWREAIASRKIHPIDLPDSAQEKLVKDPDVVKFYIRAITYNWEYIERVPEIVQKSFVHDPEILKIFKSVVIRKGWTETEYLRGEALSLLLLDDPEVLAVVKEEITDADDLERVENNQVKEKIGSLLFTDPAHEPHKEGEEIDSVDLHPTIYGLLRYMQKKNLKEISIQELVDAKYFQSKVVEDVVKNYLKESKSPKSFDVKIPFDFIKESELSKEKINLEDSSGEIEPKAPRNILNELIVYMKKKEMTEISIPEIREHKFNKDEEVKTVIKEYWKEKGYAQEIIDFAKSVKDLPKSKKGKEIAKYTKEKENLMKIPLSFIEAEGEELGFGDDFSFGESTEEQAERKRLIQQEMDEFDAEVAEDEKETLVKINFNDPEIQNEIKKFQQLILNSSTIKHQLWSGDQRLFKSTQNHAMVWALHESKIPNFVKAITVEDTHTRQELVQFQEEHGEISDERLNTSSVELYLTNTSHPNVPGYMTLGWIRYTLLKDVTNDPEDSRVWIDEIQTDLSSILGKEVLAKVFPMSKLSKLMTKKFIRFIRGQGFEKIHLPNFSMADSLYDRGNPPKSTYTTLPSSLNFKKEVIKDTHNRIDNKEVWVLAKRKSEFLGDNLVTLAEFLE